MGMAHFLIEFRLHGYAREYTRTLIRCSQAIRGKRSNKETGFPWWKARQSRVTRRSASYYLKVAFFLLEQALN